MKPRQSPPPAGPTKPVYAGKASQGKIKVLTRGQGSGIIASKAGDVFFHKTDVKGEFWDLSIGDRVTFERLDDSISGARAQNVRRVASKSPK